MIRHWKEVIPYARQLDLHPVIEDTPNLEFCLDKADEVKGRNAEIDRRVFTKYGIYDREDRGGTKNRYGNFENAGYFKIKNVSRKSCGNCCSFFFYGVLQGLYCK